MLKRDIATLRSVSDSGKPKNPPVDPSLSSFSSLSRFCSLLPSIVACIALGKVGFSRNVYVRVDAPKWITLSTGSWVGLSLSRRIWPMNVPWAIKFSEKTLKWIPDTEAYDRGIVSPKWAGVYGWIKISFHTTSIHILSSERIRYLVWKISYGGILTTPTPLLPFPMAMS